MLATLQPEIVIPGHGPLGDASLLTQMDDYLTRILTLAEGAPWPKDEDDMDDEGATYSAQAMAMENRQDKQTDETDRWITDVSPAQPYLDWAFASFFTHNVRHEVKRLHSR